MSSHRSPLTRESNDSSDRDPDEAMEDVDEADVDADADVDLDADADPDSEADDDDGGNDDDDDDEQDTVDESQDQPDRSSAQSADREVSPSVVQEADRRVNGDGANAVAKHAADRTDQVEGPSTPAGRPITPVAPPPWLPMLQPGALTARLYDIVPTMAAPQSTSINAIAITPDLRFWMTGGSDGYIRKYDGPGTINGKLPLTVAQRHGFVESVTKAGILMSYWENDEPAAPVPAPALCAPPIPAPTGGGGSGGLSPVYSLAVHSHALWLLSGLESGGINLQSVRYDEGKRIESLKQHTSAVSALTLAPDEQSVLSGGWDRRVLDWDLNTGAVRRTFGPNSSQISAIEPRPASADPFPAGLSMSDLEANGAALIQSHALSNGAQPNGTAHSHSQMSDPDPDGNESLFGGSDDGSLFFDDNEDAFARAMREDAHEVAPPESRPSPALANDSCIDLDMAASDPDAASPLKVQSPQVQTPFLKLVLSPELPSTEQEAWSDPAVGFPANSPAQPSPRPPPAPSSPSMVVSSSHAAVQHGVTQMSDSTFFSASIDGAIRVWDRRMAAPVASLAVRPGTPPWCMSACWSADGNWIYAGRRNNVVEEYSIHRAKADWAPERALKLPNGSGPVSAVRAMVNGRHLVCASHDILRLYDLRDASAFSHSAAPFLIIPGPPRAGVISALYVDPTSRFMISAAGTRGWDGTSTETLVGYEIGCIQH